MNHTRLKNLRPRKRRHAKPGAAPGTLVLAPGAKKPLVRITSYRAGDNINIEEREVSNLNDLRPHLDNPQAVTWIEVRGLGDEMTLHRIADIFKIHPLALEDVVHGQHRPKTEEYENHRFILARLVSLKSEDDMEAAQISLFLGKNYVLTLQEGSQDYFAEVRSRIVRPNGLHRRMGADYLCYSLVDAMIDNYFPVLEVYGEYLEKLEEQVVLNCQRSMLTSIHTARRELIELRRVLWPQREMFSQLLRDESPLISPPVRVFFRDCYEHSVQIMDMVENYREIVSGLHDIYLSAIGNRTNDIMRVLTIISTIFIPLTFIAGVYGMNFAPSQPGKTDLPLNMPELYHPYGYVITLAVMLVIALTLVAFFWRKGWILKDNPPPILPGLSLGKPDSTVPPADASPRT